MTIRASAVFVAIVFGGSVGFSAALITGDWWAVPLCIVLSFMSIVIQDDRPT